MPIMRGATKSPSCVDTTAGFRRIASVERMPTCGALMIGGGKCRAECAVVADRIGAAGEIVRRKLARPSPCRSAGASPWRAPIKVRLARLTHDGHDETVVIEVDRNAQIDVTRKRQRLAVEARVDLRIGGNRQTGCARNERQIRQRESVRRLKSLLASFPHAIDRGEIDLDRLEYVRDRTPALREALPGLLPHSVQRDDVALPNGKRRTRREPAQPGRAAH